MATGSQSEATHAISRNSSERVPIGWRSERIESFLQKPQEEYRGHSSHRLADVEFTEVEETEGEGPILVIPEPRRASHKRKRSTGKEKVHHKKKKGGKKRHRETLLRTKLRRQLLKKYWKLIHQRKKINKAIKDNRRHRNQLIFHREK